ncbi:MAG: hypothetical protein ACPIOQ_31345, partial [Promethearchaeia archaeon]
GSSGVSTSPTGVQPRPFNDLSYRGGLAECIGFPFSIKTPRPRSLSLALSLSLSLYQAMLT